MSTLLGNAVAATLQLVVAATILAIVFGIMEGIVTALRQYSGFDYTVTFATFLFFSLPSFWIAVMLKQYAAIEFNNWLRDPAIPLWVIAVVTLAAGISWAAVMGGSLRRRAGFFAVAAASTFAILTFLSVTRWFAEPSLGFATICVVSLSAAVGFSSLVAGLRMSDPLYAALATAGVGSLLSLVLGPILADPSWALLFGLVLATGLISAGIGYLLGGIQRRQAVTAAVLTGLFTGGLVFVDQFLRAFPTYTASVLGRPVSTIGARTPNYEGDFWQLTWDAAGHIALPTMTLVLISFATYTRYTPREHARGDAPGLRPYGEVEGSHRTHRGHPARLP